MLIRLAVVVVSLFLTASASAQPATRPIPEIDHVLIISIDGLRPDLLLRADAPTLRGMLDAGAFTLWAQTVPQAITLPSHVSMLTGVSPKKHEVDWNGDLPPDKQKYPKAPTIFEIAKAAGYTTAVVAGKKKFVALNKGGLLDHFWVPKGSIDDDAQVAREASAIIAAHKPGLMFVHLATNDAVGHSKGWGSPEQLAAVAGADAAVKRVLDAVAAAGLRDRTLVILTADHGGAGLTHGPNDTRSLCIPWILTGPVVRKAHDLTLVPKLDVQTYDTAATALWVLGLPLPAGIEGKPIKAAFARKELLDDKPATRATSRE